MVGMRCPKAIQTYELIDRVLNCLKAAALATGCEYEIRREALYLDIQQAGAMGEYLGQVCEQTWGEQGYEFEPLNTFASSDFVSSICRIVVDVQGNVSYHLPALHPMFKLPEGTPGDFPRG